MITLADAIRAPYLYDRPAHVLIMDTDPDGRTRTLFDSSISGDFPPDLCPREVTETVSLPRTYTTVFIIK